MIVPTRALWVTICAEMNTIVAIPFRLLLTGCAWLLLTFSTQAKDKSKGVRAETYTGWKDSLVLSAPGANVKAVVVPAIGGRIAHYSRGGENIIYENPAGFGKTLANTKTNFSVGGYQCDIGPEIRGILNHRELWMGPHRARLAGDFRIAVTSAADAALGVQLDKEIVIDPESGDLGITQQMKNVSDKAIAYCLWDRTLCRGGGFAFFPLNPKSRFKAGWSIRRQTDGRYVYDGDSPSDPRVRVLAGVLVTEAKGPPLKVGADSDGEWIAYARGKLLLVKFYPYFANGDYTDGGNSVEFYCDDRVAELEPLSPEAKLKPQENYAFPEKWALIQLDSEVTSPEAARALVNKIPASPFKN